MTRATSPELWRLSARELVAMRQRSEIDAADIVHSCLERVFAREPTVQAWEFLDSALAINQARRRSSERMPAPLDGVPVGIKDIIETADMPTSYGSRMYAGHRPLSDATCVSRIRAAGGIVLGKTVTTEFAAGAPAKTKNPHDAARTPGGSSSGSAAAVADCMVPLAVGTQTGGSILRPASYCGVVGYKPTFGAISRAGVKSVSPTLDHVGVLARTVTDAALLAAVLSGFDPRDPSTSAASSLQPFDDQKRQLAPKIAYVRTAWWTDAERSMRDALDGLAHRLAMAGAGVDEVALPPAFDRLLEASVIVFEVEASKTFTDDYERGRGQIGADIGRLIEAGQRRTTTEYAGAIDLAHQCRHELDRFFGRFTVILTPVATGEAPPAATTGNALFCRTWTLLGVPTLSLPCLEGPARQPMGAQLVGRRAHDADLLAVARWVESKTIG